MVETHQAQFWRPFLVPTLRLVKIKRNFEEKLGFYFPCYEHNLREVQVGLLFLLIFFAMPKIISVCAENENVLPSCREFVLVGKCPPLPQDLVEDMFVLLLKYALKICQNHKMQNLGTTGSLSQNSSITPFLREICRGVRSRGPLRPANVVVLSSWEARFLVLRMRRPEPTAVFVGSGKLL